MSIRSVLAANLRRLRKAADLTQEQLAEKAGLHRTYIGGIEQKRVNVSIVNIEKIATALNVEPAALFLDPSGDFRSVQPEKETVEYAICSWSGTDMEVFPVSVLHDDLSVQIVCGLVGQGFAGEELARAYDQTVEEVERLFVSHSRKEPPAPPQKRRRATRKKSSGTAPKR